MAVVKEKEADPIECEVCIKKNMKSDKAAIENAISITEKNKSHYT